MTKKHFFTSTKASSDFLRTLVLPALAIGLISTSAALAPIAPESFVITQPDGETFQGFPKGNMLSNWIETTDGYSVTKSKSGYWHYAELNGDGDLAPTAIKVGDARKSSLAKGTKPEPQMGYEFPKIKHPLRLSSQNEKGAGTQVPMLILLVNFEDISFGNSESAFRNLAFGSSGSINKYFKFNSYDQFEFVPAAESYGTPNDGVIQITLPMNHPNIGNNFSSPDKTTVLVDGINAADPFIDLSAFDTNNDDSLDSTELSIVYILAGYENAFGGDNAKTPNVWGHVSGFDGPFVDGVKVSPYTMFGERHATSGTADRIATVGIMCHEIGHLTFGLPDLYDYDGSSYGIGRWCLMAHGTWAGVSLQGDSPIGLSAWCKHQTEMIVPAVYETHQSDFILLPLNEVPEAIQVWIDPYKINEYFLLENRQRASGEPVLPGTGLLITHIDESISNNSNEQRKLVDVEEADGLDQIDSLSSIGDQGDLFPGTANNRHFGASTLPSSSSNDGVDTNFEVTQIASSGKKIRFDLDIEASGKGNINYVENRPALGTYGYNQPTAWGALSYSNPPDSELNLIEGIQVHIGDSDGAEINFYLYDGFSNGKLGNLIEPLGNYQFKDSGWKRIFFDTPIEFPPSESMLIVMSVTIDQNGYPLAIDYNGAPSGRSFISSTRTGTFSQIDFDYAQYLLLGTSDQELATDLWMLH